MVGLFRDFFVSVGIVSIVGWEIEFVKEWFVSGVGCRTLSIREAPKLCFVRLLWGDEE